MKHWYMQFDVNRWLADSSLSSCLPATRGIWIDILCRMHNLDRCGQVTGTRESLARQCRCTPVEIGQAADELRTSGTAEVSERDGVVTIICRCMRNEYNIRKNKKLRNDRFRTSESDTENETPPETDSETPKKPPVSYCNSGFNSDSDSPIPEGKVSKGEGLSPLGKRIATWFRRRETTKWDARELKALRAVEALSTPEEDIVLLERRYLANEPYLRQDILTLLNNWNGEIDRAKKVRNNFPVPGSMPSDPIHQDHRITGEGDI